MTVVAHQFQDEVVHLQGPVGRVVNVARRVKRVVAVCAAVAVVGVGWKVVVPATPAAPVANVPAGSEGNAARLPLALLYEAAPSTSVPYLTDNPELVTKEHFDLNAGRVAATDAAGSHVIAVPRLGGAEICVIATEPAAPRSGGGGCVKRENFLQRGVIAVRIRGTSAEVIGLMPDGVAMVVGTDPAGVERTFPVRRNAIRIPLEQARVIMFTIDGKPVVEDFRSLRTDL